VKLNLEQKKSLSNYSGNLSIAWFAAGIIGPIVTKQSLNDMSQIMLISLVSAGIFLTFMLVLIKGKERKRRI
jgi:hypothetical protein